MKRNSAQAIVMFALILTLSMAPFAAAGPGSDSSFEKFDGRCVKVIDGDTLVIDCDGEKRTIHLAGIDAPELKQRMGKNIRQFVQRTVKGQNLEVQMVPSEGPDHARVFVNGKDLSLFLAELGFAWPAEGTAQSENIQKVSDRARNHPSGIWIDGNPEPPWEYRAAM